MTHSPHQPKLASGHTHKRPGERVFFIAPLAAKPRPENALVYDELASGATYIESDPIGLVGGSYSTYGYVNNNPISRSDPLGLFLYDIHWQLTYNATGLAYLADLVAGVDSEPGSQDPGFSDMHAMRAPWETPEQGKQNYNWYLQSELSKCSIQGLAHALHAAQDSASASHQGFQVWDGGSFGVHFPGFSHMWHDAFPTPQEWNNATQNTRAILNQFKNTCACGK